MDELDKRILNIIQSGFPLAEFPYREIGDQVGLDEDQTWRRIQAMRESGLIRRIGANFQSNKLGHASTLCAASVPLDRLEEAEEAINAHPGVTHNYLRNHHYNLWFTIISPDEEGISAAVMDIERQIGAKVMNLPASKLFKIKVDFLM